MQPLVQIKDLRISFSPDAAAAPAVNRISFDILPGKVTALIGESGSGKSLTALSIMQLLPSNALLSGEILFSENENSGKDLVRLPDKEIRHIRGNRIAMIFQEPMTALNPLQTCGAQVMESLLLHKKLPRSAARSATLELFRKTELPNPELMLKRYPHQISGGQKQRVMIAMAMSCNPALLIADEPTTALDVRVQKNILVLLKKLQAETGMAILFISHDLALVADIADELLVMYRGNIAERGNASSVLTSPQHEYTKSLMACKPGGRSKGKKLPVIGEAASVAAKALVVQPAISSEVILAVNGLTVKFPENKNIFGKAISEHTAVNDVSFNIYENETVGLVGESGCGKTTLGKAILGLIVPDAGTVSFRGQVITGLPAGKMRAVRKELQVVFQDPYGSLNPRLTIGEAVSEPIKIHHPLLSKQIRRDKAVHLLEEVGMKSDVLQRYPHEFSGGQRQRICLARALSTEPDFLVFDESVSALDVSVQAIVLNLINDLKQRHGFTALFISHDLSVVHYISNRIMVMYKGTVIESGTADEIIFRPRETYTKELIAAVPGKILQEIVS